MSKSTYRKSLATLVLSAALAGGGLALADETPAAGQATATGVQRQGDWDNVVQLGDIQVQGDRLETSRKIVAGLKVIKRALVAKLSNDPAHADDIVCRMNYDTGSHVMVHLRCATNSVLRAERNAIATGMTVNTNGQAGGAEAMALEHFVPMSPKDRYFSTKVSASRLQELLLMVNCDGCSETGLVVGND